MTQLKKHKRKHEEGQTIAKWMAPKCQICSEVFTNTKSLRQHMDTHDPDILKKLKFSKRPKCDPCHMTFVDVRRLEIHLKNHDKNARVANTCCSYKKSLPHRCDECHICFKTN